MKQGFTLSEIMAVVCIIAIVASTAMPAIDSFMSSQKVSAEGEAFVSNVRMARYKAMQENALHRLVFDEDAEGNVSGYKIQIYGKYPSAKDEYFNQYDDNDEDLYDLGDGPSRYVDDSIQVNLRNISLKDTNWKSILDYDEVIINADIEAKHDSSSLQTVIYFYPTGYLVRGAKDENRKIIDYSPKSSDATDNLVNNDNNYINEETMTFKYGNAKVVVHFNAMGILSSEILNEDEEEE